MVVSDMIINEHYEGLNPMSCGQEKCAPGHSYGPAVRTHWLLHYVVSGCGIFVKDGITHHIKAGETFVIAPYEETFYQADAHDPWHYIWLGFSGQLPRPLEEAVLRVPALGDIFTDTQQSRRMTGGKSAFLCGKLWELFACLMEAEQPTCHNYVDQAVHCMQLEYADGITVSEIARRLHLNRSYFSSLFKEQLGVTPQAYLSSLRTQKAIELMIQYRTSPTIAALSTGYSDLYQFSRMFKRHTGLSPRAYIAQHSATK